jgi:hypothetical protein
MTCPSVVNAETGRDPKDLVPSTQLVLGHPAVQIGGEQSGANEDNYLPKPRIISL